MKKKRDYVIVEICKRCEFAGYEKKSYKIGYKKKNIFGITKLKYLTKLIYVNNDMNTFIRARTFDNVEGAKEFMQNIKCGIINESGDPIYTTTETIIGDE